MAKALINEKIENLILEKTELYRGTNGFYRKKYSGVNIVKYSDIPLIRKQDLLQDQMENPPFGSNINIEREKIVRIHRTSGTSGKPLLLAMTRNDIAAVVNAGARAFGTAGMGPGDIVFNCMNYCMWMGGFTDHMSMEATGAAVVPYGVGRTENLIEILLDMDGPSLHSTPSYLNIISKTLKDKYNKKPLELGLKKGFFGGESGMQDKQFREKIEADWGMRAMNANYGMSEAMSIMGSECAECNGLHFTAEQYLYAELRKLDSECASAEDIKEGAIGELVVTNFEKEAQPLARYCTGDVIEIVSTGDCLCGEKSFRFRVIGRCDDMIVIKGINFYPESIRTIISSHKECSGNYIIQVPGTTIADNIKIIIHKTDANAGHALCEEIRNEIRSKFFISPIIELVDDIRDIENKQKIVERVPYV